VQAELEARNRRIVDLESRVAKAEADLGEATASTETLRERAAAADRIEREYTAVQEERDRLEQSLAETKVEATSADKEADVGRLEELLRERAEHIRKLDAELREAERLGRELVKELATSEIGRSGPQADPRQPEAASAENARLRADLESAQWTIQELENRLDHALRRTAEDGRSDAPPAEAANGARIEAESPKPDGAR